MIRLYSSQCRQLASAASIFSPSVFINSRPCINFNANQEEGERRRYFSELLRLRRPPSSKKRGVELDGKYYDDNETNQKWRSHAISLEYSNYDDDDDVNDRYNNRNYGYTNSGYSHSNSRSHSITKHTSSSIPTSPENSPSPLSSSSSWHEEEVELADRVREIQQEADERKKRWLENAKPPLRRPIVDERGRSYGRGGRKTASARVWIQPGFGNVVVNRKDFVDYFERTTDREQILEPLAATETLGRFDVTATVQGGGLRGQAGAIRHGLARALNHYNPNLYRPPLKRLGYLTRDPRKVERKKIGHLKARKKPQWNRR